MKKSLLAFSLMALGSLQLSAAPCQIGGVGVTLASLGIPGCEITNGTNTWNLNTFGFSNGNPTFTNYTGSPSANTSSFNVTFGLNPMGFAGGFSVTLTPVAQNFPGFTAGGTAQGAQQFSMETTFRIAGNTGAAQLNSFGGSLDGPTVFPIIPAAGVPNPAVTLQKFIQRLNSTNVQYVMQPDTSSIGVLPGSSRVTSATGFNPLLQSPNNPGDLVIVDRIRLDGGNTIGNSASLISYTNYFAPTAQQTGIPEPMTFALMGAGLVGLAFLRRRK